MGLAAEAEAEERAADGGGGGTKREPTQQEKEDEINKLVRVARVVPVPFAVVECQSAKLLLPLLGLLSNVAMICITQPPP